MTRLYGTILSAGLALCIGVLACSDKPKEVVDAWPEGWLITVDGVWVPILDELGEYLSDARQAFIQDDPETAVAEINKGVSYLEKTMPETPEDTRSYLNTAADRLKRLTDAIQNGNVRSVVRLDSAFAAAYQTEIEYRWITQGPEAWASVTDAPGRHLMQAKTYLKNDDYEATAAELRKAEAFFRLEARRAGGLEEDALKTAAADLSRKAKDAEEGALTPFALDATVTRAYQALAIHHSGQSQLAWSRMDTTGTGYEYNSALRYAERTAEDAGYAMKTSAADTLQTGKDTRYVSDEIDRKLKKLKEEIDAMGNMLDAPGDS